MGICQEAQQRPPPGSMTRAMSPTARAARLGAEGGDGGLQRVQNAPISRRFVTPLLPICAPTGEREPHLVAHPALRGVPVEPLNERAAVRMPELVGDYMRRQSALHEQRRARVAELVELELVALAPTLPDHSERVGERTLGEPSTSSRVEQIRTVKPWWDISESRERWRRDRHDARLPILRWLLAALAVDREANRALGALDVDICS